MRLLVTPQMTREGIGGYLISLMALPGVHVDDECLFDAVRRWSQTTDAGFDDAYLSVRAEREQIPVYTKNIRHFQRFGIETPDPLSR